jgi:hypothetical protein
MNAVADAPRPGASAGTPVLMAKLAALGTIAGAISWGLINYADELNLKVDFEGFGLVLLPISLFPGLVFGLLFGAVMGFSATTSWLRSIGYGVAAGLSYIVAFHVAFYIITTGFDDKESLWAFAVGGVPAGLAGSMALGLLAMLLLQVPARLALRRPVIVGTLAGALLVLGGIDDHNGWGFLAFFVLWQGVYGASLAPMIQAGAKPSA